MSVSVTVPARTGLVHLPLGLGLQNGGELDCGQLAFELDGPDGAPVVLVLGGISADRQVRSWWPGLVGPGRAIPTDRLRVLGVDYLGGAGASTGPSRGAPLPALSPADQARAIAALCDELGIDRLSAIVGASYGGMVGLAFAAAHGPRLERLVAISAPARSHPLATAWRSLQRKVVRLGVARGAGRESLALARGLAMTTYRSGEEFGQRFSGPSTPPDAERPYWRFPVDAYLENRGEDFVARLSPEQFLCLSESLDLHAVDPRFVRVPTTVVAVEGDQLVPFAELESLARELGGPARLVAVRSRFGHDAFLKEVDAIGRIVRDALEASR